MELAKQRIVGFILIVSCCGVLMFVEPVAAQSDRPTFYPNRTRTDQPGTRPALEQDAPAGRDILGAEPGPPYGYRNEPDPYGTGYPSYRPEISPMLLGGDPIALIPHAIDMANKYGIVQCLAVFLAAFLFQYVRNAQKHAVQREEFFRQQLEYSDKRATEELTRLSSKLGMMEQDLRAMQDHFDRHAELIRMNGQLCREIVSTMTAHNQAVEQGIAEIETKIDHLASRVKRKLKNNVSDDRT